MRKYLRKSKNYTPTILNSIILMIVLYCSLFYVKHINLFARNNVVVLGNAYVQENTILDAININEEGSIFSYDLGILQKNVESIEFIKSAKVSIILPSTLMIQILERSPVVLVLLDANKYFFDDEQTPLLATKEAINFFPVPVMIFDNDKTLKLGDFELTKALRFINKSRANHSQLYENLSEVRYKNNNLSLITDERTKIDLGDKKAIYKINILKEFQNTVNNKRSLNDYAYINLKIDNQIIVREH